MMNALDRAYKQIDELRTLLKDQTTTKTFWKEKFYQNEKKVTDLELSIKTLNINIKNLYTLSTEGF